MGDVRFIETPNAKRAQELLRAGRSADVLDHYVGLLQSRLARIRKEGGEAGDAELELMEQVADLAARCGYFEPADELLRSMVSVCQSSGDHFAADYVVVKRGQLAMAQGDLAGCRSRLTELEPRIGALEQIDFRPDGLEAWERRLDWSDTIASARAVFLSDLYLTLGRLLCARGQYGDALSAFERGLVHAAKDAPDRVRRSEILLRLSIAAAHLEGGDTMAARSELDGIEASIDPVRDAAEWVMWLETAGRLELLMGQLGVAVGHLQAVGALCAEGGFDRAARAARLNFADVLILLNQTARACEILAELDPTAEEAPVDEIGQRARFLLEVAEARGRSLAEGAPIAPAVVELWQGRRSRGASATEREQADPLELPQAAGFLTFFDDHALAFQSALAARDVARAEMILTGMEEAFKFTDSKLIHLRMGVLRSLLAYYQGEFEQAEAKLKFSVPAFETRQLKPELWQILRVLGWCAKRLGRPEGEWQRTLERCNALLEEIGQSLNDPSSQAIYLLNKWTAEEELLAGRIDELVLRKQRAMAGPALVRPFRRMALARGIARLCDHVDRRRGELTERLLSPRARGPSVPGFWRRLLGHGLRQVTVSFLVLPDRVLVIRSGFLSLDFGVSPLTRIQLRELVASWHEAVRQISSARDLSANARADAQLHFDSVQKELSRRLSQALQLELLADALPKRIRALRVIPDDILHGLPFAALPHSEHSLAKRFAIHVAFESQPRRRSGARQICGTRLLVGVSQYAGGEYQPLAGVPAELNRVSHLLASAAPCESLLDDAATKAAVVAALSEAGLVHIACHGIFKPDRPDASGFVLLGSSSGKTETLSLRELSSLELTRIRHATLSSCYSADSFVGPGLHVISLPEALCHAGVGSVLGSLWPVDDRSAVAFMSRFYELVKDHRRDEALRQTQLDCSEGRLMADGEAVGTSPYYWAGFVLYGDGGRLQL